MSLDDPVIITCAMSGALANRECPAIRYTPQEYAAEARRTVDEGAVMIHIRARPTARWRAPTASSSRGRGG